MTKKSQPNHYAIYALAAGAILLAGGASAYYITQGKKAEPQVTQQTTQRAPSYAQAQPAQQAPAQPQCDDNNIVGTGAGAIAGGLIGHQIGKGKGNTAATIGGAAGGAMLGQKYIPTDGVTCR